MDVNPQDLSAGKIMAEDFINLLKKTVDKYGNLPIKVMDKSNEEGIQGYYPTISLCIEQRQDKSDNSFIAITGKPWYSI